MTLQASQARRRLREITTYLLVISAAIAVVNLFLPRQPTGNWLDGHRRGLLYVAAPVIIARHLVLRRTVDTQTILGAIAAYLMIGMSFAFAYLALGALQAGPFFGSQGEGNFSQDLFFSFTTLTTTGYGNLVPAANPGQSLAVGEMLIGQLFLVTAVAKAVSTWRLRPRPPTPTRGGRRRLSRPGVVTRPPGCAYRHHRCRRDGHDHSGRTMAARTLSQMGDAFPWLGASVQSVIRSGRSEISGRHQRRIGR